MTVYISKNIRQAVKERAKSYCEYCKKPTGYTFYNHHIDHIIPPLHGGNNELDNLAFACFQCNSAKSSQIASYDLITRELVALFNPRQDNWDAHFEIYAGEIIGKTPIGRVTVRVLQMNETDEVNMRRTLISAGVWG